MNAPDRPLRILHLVSSGRWTGAAEPVANLAATQRRHGQEVSLACVAGGSFERRIQRRGVTRMPGFRFDRRLNPAHFLADMAHLRATVRRWKPDVIHCHLPHDHWICALALRTPYFGLRGKRPVIIRTMHRETAPRRDLAHRWLVGKGADAVITVSESQRRRIIEKVGLPSDRVTRVRGAVNLNRFHPDLPGDDIREQYRITPQARVAGMVARMRPGRGHHWFLSAVEAVAKALPEAVLAIAGRGELKRELVTWIRSHPNRTNLRRLCYHKKDLEKVYAAMDVAVLLAPGSDGSCRAMLEAMACGRPVIGVAEGAIADAILPGVNGWLVAREDKAGLCRALIEALGDPERTRAMGLAARKHVETHHTVERQFAETQVAYEAALLRRAKKVRKK